MQARLMATAISLKEVLEVRRARGVQQNMPISEACRQIGMCLADALRRGQAILPFDMGLAKRASERTSDNSRLTTNNPSENKNYKRYKTANSYALA
jgi:hypothetical protein